MVARGELPPGLALGGKKVWLAGKVLAWIAEAAEGEERKARQDRLGIRRLHP
jgi:predicted DNA-binding transcriptional regulator AlpA